MPTKRKLDLFRLMSTLTKETKKSAKKLICHRQCLQRFERKLFVSRDRAILVRAADHAWVTGPKNPRLKAIQFTSEPGPHGEFIRLLQELNNSPLCSQVGPWNRSARRDHSKQFGALISILSTKLGPLMLT